MLKEKKILKYSRSRGNTDVGFCMCAMRLPSFTQVYYFANYIPFMAEMENIENHHSVPRPSFQEQHPRTTAPFQPFPTQSVITKEHQVVQQKPKSGDFQNILFETIEDFEKR